MPFLYVALHSGIHSDSGIPNCSKKSLNLGVEPSPTPIMPISGDSIRVILIPLLAHRLAIKQAAIQPAVPPPKIVTVLIGENSIVDLSR